MTKPDVMQRVTQDRTSQMLFMNTKPTWRENMRIFPRRFSKKSLKVTEKNASCTVMRQTKMESHPLTESWDAFHEAKYNLRRLGPAVFPKAIGEG